MNDTERYLRRATRGTWGRKRADIREELAAHIDERVQIHRMGGLGEAEAVEKALSELGEAGQVSAGMMKLHSMPTLLGSSFLLSVMVAFVVLAAPPSTAQTLEASALFPSQECLESSDSPNQKSKYCFRMSETHWTNIDSLATALEPSGVQVEKSIYGAKLTFADETISVPLFGVEPILIDGQEGFSTAQGYFDFWKFIESFSIASSLPIYLSGLERPELTLGDASLDIDTTAFSSEGTGFGFYKSYLYAVLEDEFFTTSYLEVVAPRLNENQEELSESLSLSVETEPGDVYGLVIKLDPEDELVQAQIEAYDFDFIPAPNPFLVDIVEADGDTLEFYSKGETRFVEPPPLGNRAETGDAILVKLTGGADGTWYEIISPEAITLN